jgi:hypothetical protein
LRDGGGRGGDGAGREAVEVAERAGGGVGEDGVHLEVKVERGKDGFGTGPRKTRTDAKNRKLGEVVEDAQATHE